MIEKLLPPDSPRVVYDIRRDLPRLENIRKASLSEGPWGVTLSHGVVGSDEWWLAIENGVLKVEAFSGTVRAVAGGMMGDTLKVYIDGDQKKESWVAWAGFSRTLEGKRVCTRHVKMSPKKPIEARHDDLVPVLLQVELLD